MTSREKKLLWLLLAVLVAAGSLFLIQGFFESQAQRTKEINSLKAQIQAFRSDGRKLNYPEQFSKLETEVKSLESSLWKKGEISSLGFADMISDLLKKSGVQTRSFTLLKETVSGTVFSFILDSTPLAWFNFLINVKESDRAIFFPSVSIRMGDHGVLRVAMEVGYAVLP